MNRKRDIDLIIPEVLGCQEEKDKKNLQFLKENDEAFSWKDLGDFQNLAAMFASISEIETPSKYPKERFVKYLNRLIFGKEDIAQPEKFVLDKTVAEEIIEEIHLDKSSIDWSSLAVSESSKSVSSGFKEVRSRKKEFEVTSAPPVENTVSSEELEFEEEYVESSGNSQSQNIKSSPSLKKYYAVAIFLFLIIASIAAYMLLINRPPSSEQVAVEDKPLDKPFEKVEEFVFDSLKDFGQKVDTVDLQSTKAVVVVDKPKKEESLLPKAPPKLPDPIEAPLISVEETVNEENPIVEEKISAPPPKEVIEDVEEPTFFVAVEEMPQPIGGLHAIQEKIQYPEIAKRAGVEGKVFVRAYVDENGNVVDAEVVKGIGGGCDEAALEAILKTKFSPGKQRGKPIKVQVTVPVLFKL